MGSSPTVRTSYLAGAAGLSELAGQAAGLAHPVALPEPTAQALDRCRQRAIEVEAGQVVAPCVGIAAFDRHPFAMLERGGALKDEFAQRSNVILAHDA